VSSIPTTCRRDAWPVHEHLLFGTIAALVLLLLSPLVRKWMGGVK
jgi:hypothetical protein